MNKSKRFKWESRPEAIKSNIVSGDKYRFTVLTESLIRIEFDWEGKFEDRASQTVFFRDLPQVEYTTENKDGILKVETEKLILTYYGEKKLSIKLKTEPGSVWNYGEDFDDLGGTTKTLDETNGPIPIERGLCSRNGFSVIDDTASMLLDENGWITPRRKNTEDVYFFGYGFDYIGCIRDFYKITGAPSFLPAYAFGNWWSRYHKYTQDEYIETMDAFAKEDVPLSVGIVDMDWHITKIPEDKKSPVTSSNGVYNTEDGWTGYTFNKELFPDRERFLNQLKERSLHTAFNLHPHAGVRCHEEMYEEMASACGIDPKSRKPVPFNVISPEFMANYFDILHHPYEKEGVDFWWMDWQQGTDYWWIHKPNENGVTEDEREAVDPLWMLNHLHVKDISRNGKRPMFFSRYCGPGSHRYSIGFSGDTCVSWASLDFQPYFTATASNIGYCWWSHDIGGHMRGYKDDELTARWVQLGVLSPINRLHSSSDRFLHKEPWMLDDKYKTSVENWMRLRHSLFPYIYTMNYKAYKELIPFVRPIYYYYPKKSEAYEFKNQFFFGSELMVAPITSPASQITGLGEAKAYLPAGDWFDFFRGVRYHSKKSGRCVKLFRDIMSYPVLAKAGAIVPLNPHKTGDNTLGISDVLDLYVFPGADNVFTLYEDEGDYSRFEDGVYAETKITLNWNDKPELCINPASGDASILPVKRTWNIKLRGFSESTEFTVYLNGAEIKTDAVYDENTCTVGFTVTAAPTDIIDVKLANGDCITDNPNADKICDEILRKSNISYEEKNQMFAILKNKDYSLHKKLFRLSGRSYDKEVLTDAIREIMTLTEEEYSG